MYIKHFIIGGDPTTWGVATIRSVTTNWEFMVVDICLQLDINVQFIHSFNVQKSEIL